MTEKYNFESIGLLLPKMVELVDHHYLEVGEKYWMEGTELTLENETASLSELQERWSFAFKQFLPEFYPSLLLDSNECIHAEIRLVDEDPDDEDALVIDLQLETDEDCDCETNEKEQ